MSSLSTTVRRLLARPRVVCTEYRPASRFTGRRGDEYSRWPIHSPAHVEWVPGQGEKVRCRYCHFTWIRFAAEIPEAKQRPGLRKSKGRACWR